MFAASKQDSGNKLFSFCREKLPSLSKKNLRLCFAKGNIILNGVKVPPGSAGEARRVAEGDKIEIIGISRQCLAETRLSSSFINIVYSDHSFAVIFKDAGTSCAVGRDFELTIQKNLWGGGKVYFLYRLEKNLSGLCIIAKCPAVLLSLYYMLIQKRLLLHYQCIVVGSPGSIGTRRSYETEDVDCPLLTITVVAVGRSRGADVLSTVDIVPVFDVNRINNNHNTSKNDYGDDNYYPTRVIRAIRTALRRIGHPIVGDAGVVKSSQGRYAVLRGISFHRHHHGGDVAVAVAVAAAGNEMIMTMTADDATSSSSTSSIVMVTSVNGSMIIADVRSRTPNPIIRQDHTCVSSINTEVISSTTTYYDSTTSNECASPLLQSITIPAPVKFDKLLSREALAWDKYQHNGLDTIQQRLRHRNDVRSRLDDTKDRNTEDRVDVLIGRYDHPSDSDSEGGDYSNDHTINESSTITAIAAAMYTEKDVVCSETRQEVTGVVGDGRCQGSEPETVKHEEEDDNGDDNIASVITTCTEGLAAGIPLEYLLGEASFDGLRFGLGRDRATMIPRTSSECLVHTAVASLTPLLLRGTPVSVLDLGTGGGCLLLSCLHRLQAIATTTVTTAAATPNDIPVRATGVGIDISEGALEVARANAAALNLSSSTSFIQMSFSDMWKLTPSPTAIDRILIQHNYKVPFDVIMCNPPYSCRHERGRLSRCRTLYEPPLALFAPNHPMDCYKDIAVALKNLFLADYTTTTISLLATDNIMSLSCDDTEQKGLYTASPISTTAYRVNESLLSVGGSLVLEVGHGQVDAVKEIFASLRPFLVFKNSYRDVNGLQTPISVQDHPDLNVIDAADDVENNRNQVASKMLCVRSDIMGLLKICFRVS
eukprot:gene1021-2003_t